MDIKIRKWSHDWEHFNFGGVSVADESKADGMSSLSWNEVMEYMEWLAINKPQKYGKIMMTMGNVMNVSGKQQNKVAV